ncbi:MAG: DUF927 domain-containing protein [Solimonas sp.]
MSPLLSLADVLSQFVSAMRAAGIETAAQIVASGKLERFRVEGDKAGSKNGFYVLHADGVPAGLFGCYKRDIKEKWQANIGRKLTDDEQAEMRKRQAAAEKARAAEQAAMHDQACTKALKLWNEASESVHADHRYLVSKRVRAYGLRQLRDSLLVPVLKDGVRVGLQFIKPDGGKMFLTGTAKSGAFFEIGGEPGAPDVVSIVEGYATGASVREATGWPVVVAFDAGNLLSVAKAVRKARPEAVIVLAADNDHRTDGNPGLTKAQTAAQAVGAVVCAPDFAEGERGTDWNDYAAVHGLRAVADRLSVALASCVEPQIAGPGGAAQPQALPPPAGAPPPPPDDHAGERFEVTPAGVFWIGMYQDKAGRWREKDPMFLCSPLHVEAVTRDPQDAGYGRLVNFMNVDGKRKELVLPAPLFGGGKGDDLRGRLLSEGLPRIGLDSMAQRKLMEYLMHTTPASRARCVQRTGWQGTVYVLPRQSFGGDGSERFYFASESDGQSPYAQAGTLEGWRDSVSKPAGSHRRAMFALSCAFAGPLIELAGAESGGFHLVGGSSSGKTTALRLASTVWGHPSHYWRQWRTTDNGLEALAEDYNDSLLCLDEIGQADPRIVGDVAYMLANGRGKQRARREGGSRASRMFRVLLLSTGEVGSAAQINASGQRDRPGHEVRMVEVPADAGKGYGLFDSAGEYDSPRALAGALVESAAQHYGYAGPRFVEHVARNRQPVASDARERVRNFVEYVCPLNADGQVQRVAARFGLVAFAGELATGYGLTGWQYKDVEFAAADAFGAWLEKRGTAGAKEPADMVAQVRRFIEEHGGSQFQEIDRAATADAPAGSDEHEARIMYRAGFRKQSNGSTLYLCFPEKFKGEICKGYDHVEVCKALAAAGILWRREGDGARYTSKHRVPGFDRPIPFYALDGARLYGASVH